MKLKTINIKKEFSISKEEFEEKEKEVFKFFLVTVEHITKSLVLLRKNEDLIKSELVLLMVYADVFSRLLEIFNKPKNKNILSFILVKLLKFKKNNFNNKERFQKWFGNFVFTDKNKTWKQYGYDINCNEKIIWLLRNSLLHFYGLPSKPSIMLMGGSFERAEFKELEKRSRLINVNYLAEAIKEGAIVQFEYMKTLLRDNPEKYIWPILEMHEIIKKEATELIKKNYTKNK